MTPKDHKIANEVRAKLTKVEEEFSPDRLCMAHSEYSHVQQVGKK